MVERYRLQPGEAYNTLTEHVAGMPQLIEMVAPFGHLTGADIGEPYLGEETQVLLWGMIAMVTAVFRSDHCLATLEYDNIVVTSVDRNVKLGDAIVVSGTKPLRVSNMLSLAAVFRSILSKPTVPIPREVHHLLYMMERQAEDMMYLIQFHPCLVPIDNRCDYFLRMQMHLTNMSVTDSEGHEYVLKNLIFSETWHLMVHQRNSILQQIYSGRGYNPIAAAQIGRKAAAGLVVRFNRNGCAHGQEYSSKVRCAYGLMYSRRDLARMLYAIFDLLPATMAAALHRLGVLEQLRLDSLFPGRIMNSP